MKIIFKLLSVASFIILILPSTASAQNTQDFRFEGFDANYYLQKEADGSSAMSVNETLQAVFPEYDQNHGILRAIPEVYKSHKLRLGSISVTQDGQPAKYSAYHQNSNLVLKIGDANTYVHGSVTYKINYQLHDVISFFPDHDELYWDINGDQWPQPFGSVIARIHIPDNLAKNMQERQRCYVGPYGSNSQNCSITRIDAGAEFVVIAKADAVGANKSLSTVLAFNQGTFQLSPAAKKEMLDKKIMLITAAIFGFGLPLAAGIFMFNRWRAFGNDPKGRGVIIPEYEPPKGFSPLTADFLLKQKLRNEALSATLIDQAVKGDLTIIEIPKKGIFGKKDYELVLKSTPENNSEEENEALQAIFGDGLTPGRRINVSSFRNDYKLQSDMYKSLKKLEKNLASNLFVRGFFKKNPKSVLGGYRTWAVILILLPAFGAFAVDILKTVGVGLAIGLFLAGVVVFVFSFIMPARTETGVRAHDDLLGLKDYIKLAEADRLKFLQSPEGAEKLPVAEQFDPKSNEAKVKLFEKLLPYAMLFGLEKDWAKQFEGIYANPPNWYQGGSWSAFNMGYLAGSLSDFNDFTATNFSSPSSSSGSGFSGGGAGGGGGGGGGGGW
jgi:uncharacterized membrane protein YgcG